MHAHLRSMNMWKKAVISNSADRWRVYVFLTFDEHQLTGKFERYSLYFNVPIIFTG